MKFNSSLLLILLTLQLTSCSSTSETETPIVGPTGKLLYTSGLSIYEYDIAKKSSTFLTAGEGAIRLGDSTLLLNLDGDLVIKSTDGSQLIRTIVKRGSVDKSIYDEGIYQHLSISPDGKHIAYCNTSIFYCWVVSATTGELEHELSATLVYKNLANPSWLNDSTLVLNGFNELIKYNLKAGSFEKLQPSGASMPEPSTDKSRIAFITSMGNVSLIEGSEETQLINRNEDAVQAVFSPDDKWLAVLLNDKSISFYNIETKVDINHSMSEHPVALSTGIFW